MSNLPLIAVHRIIEYIPNSNIGLINKEYNKEYNYILKKAVGKISNWFYLRRCRLSSIDDCKNIKDMLRLYLVKRDRMYLKYLPERLMNVFNINPMVLSVISPSVHRKNSEIINWVYNLPLVFNDYKHSDIRYLM